MRFLLVITGFLLVSCGVFRGDDVNHGCGANKNELLWFTISVQEILPEARDVKFRLELTNITNHPVEVDEVDYFRTVYPQISSLSGVGARRTGKPHYRGYEPRRTRLMPDSSAVWLVEGFAPTYELSPDEFRVQFDYYGGVYDTLGNLWSRSEPLRSNTVEFEIAE